RRHSRAGDHEIRVAAEQCRERGHEPGEGNVHGNVLRQSRAIKKGHGGEMVRRAVAAGREIERARTAAHERDELLQLRTAMSSRTSRTSGASAMSTMGAKSLIGSLPRLRLSAGIAPWVLVVTTTSVWPSG